MFFFVQAREETQKKNLAQENESLRRQLKAFGNKSELMESVMWVCWVSLNNVLEKTEVKCLIENMHCYIYCVVICK